MFGVGVVDVGKFDVARLRFLGRSGILGFVGLAHGEVDSTAAEEAAGDEGDEEQAGIGGVGSGVVVRRLGFLRGRMLTLCGGGGVGR